MNLETARGGGRRNEMDDCLEAAKRFATPVLGEVGEQTVFDLIPLAGSRWEVTHRDSQPGFIGELL